MVEFDLKDLIRSLRLDQDLPDPDMISYYANARNRTFFVDYEIERDDDTGYSRLMELSKIIIRMNMDEMHIPKEKLRPVIVIISTFGGSVEEAFFFSDLIKASRIPIITVCSSVAMSAGFLILISGVKRYAFKHSQLLIHSGSLGLAGTAEQAKAAMENYKRMLSRMKKYILENTNISEELFNKNRTKDWYIEPNYALKVGVIDKIVENFEDIIPKSMLEYNEYYDKPINGFNKKNSKKNIDDNGE